VILWKSKPIEAKARPFSCLAGKMASFSRNMNGAQTSLLPIGQIRNWKMENRNWKTASGEQLDSRFS